MQKALFLLLSAAMLLCLHPAAAQQPNTLTGTVTDSASGKAEDTCRLCTDLWCGISGIGGYKGYRGCKKGIFWF